MKILIQESQIFGPTSTFCQYTSLSQVTLEIFENFQKRTSRNRYFILSANGTQMLSIPLCRGKNNQQHTKDVRISYEEDWVRKHINALKSAYGKSPYFEYYYPEMEKLLLNKYTFLFDLNTVSLQLMLKYLGLNLEILFTNSYQNSSIVTVERANIKKNQNSELINYPQVWQEKFNFTPNLSIIDLLFCTGPEATSILKRMNSFVQMKPL